MTSKQVSILGSTGSIGESTLDVIRNSSEFEVFAVSAHRNTKLLLEQCKEFNPSFAVLVDDSREGSDNFDMAEGETPFESSLDAFGIAVAKIYDHQNPVGSVITIDLGSVA